MQNAHVVQIGLVGSFGQQCIVGTAELQRGEERLAEHVAAEGAGLANQRMDDVTVVDPVVIAPHQALHDGDSLTFVIELDDVSMQAYPQLTPDQPRRHRVGVFEDAHRARARDGHIRLPVRR